MKQCEKCGNEIMEGAAFCTNCGAPVTISETMATEAVATEVPGGQMPMGESVVSEAESSTSMAEAIGVTSSPVSNPNPVVENPVNTPNPALGTPNLAINPRPMVSNPVTSPNPMANNLPPVSNVAVAPEKKFKMNLPMVIMGVFAAVCLVIGIVGIVVAANSNNNSSNGTNNGEISAPSTSGSDSNGGSGSSNGNSGNGSNTTTNYTNGTTVSVSGCEFVVPNDYEYEISMGYLMITAGDFDWAAKVAYWEDYTYSSVETIVDTVMDGGVEGIEGFEGYTGGYYNYNGESYPYLIAPANDGTGRSIVSVMNQVGLYYAEAVIVTKGADIDPMDYIDDALKVSTTATKVPTSNRAFGDEAEGGIDINVNGHNAIVKIMEK